LWDIRQLLTVLAHTSLVAEVDADLSDLPAEMHALWTRARKPDTDR